MDSKAYFEKVMQDFNQFREGRSFRKYFQMRGSITIGSSSIRKSILHYDVNGYVLYVKRKIII